MTAAHTLTERGATVTLVEAEPRLGGKIRTERLDGYLIDAGPDSFLSSKPAAIALATRLGIDDRLIDTRRDGGGTFILRAGTLQPLPEGITLLVPADLRSIVRTPLLSPLGKLRMLLDYVIPARKGEADESVGAFVRRRLGREAFERMAEPLLSGIYAGDANTLSLASTFPRLRAVERAHGGMVRGAIAQRRSSSSSSATPNRRTPFVSFNDGLDDLIVALRNALGNVDVRTGVAAARLARSGAGWEVLLADRSRLHADGIVLAIPSYAAATLVSPHSHDLASALNEIPWSSTATISLAFPVAALPGGPVGRGFVVPRAEGRALTAITWTSNKFAGRAPDSMALLRGFVGRAGNEAPAALPDDMLVALVRQEINEILGIRTEPTLARVYRWPKALPQYTLGHPERLARITAALADLPGIALTGNSYRGVGLPDCITDATQQANTMLDALHAARAAQPTISR